MSKIQTVLESTGDMNDGQARTIRLMLVPIEGGIKDREEIHDVCRGFVEKTGESYDEYREQHGEID